MSEPAAELGSLWTTGEVVEIVRIGDRLVRLRLDVAERVDHLPGQHYVVRLRAPDGYTAQRSYSIASEPERAGEIDITVERIEGGEVSPFLHDTVVPGDRLEVRGPIGGYFVWEAELGGPLFLVAGGSGVVPLMAMLRHRARAGSPFQALMKVWRCARPASPRASW